MRKRNWFVDLFRSKKQKPRQQKPSKPKPMEIELKVIKNLSVTEPSELKVPSKKTVSKNNRVSSPVKNNVDCVVKSKHEERIAKWLQLPNNEWLKSRTIPDNPAVLLRRAANVIVAHNLEKLISAKQLLQQACYDTIRFYQMPKERWPEEFTLSNQTHKINSAIFYYCRDLVNHAKNLIELPREIYILGRVRSPINAKSADQFYPWLPPVKMKPRNQPLRRAKHGGPRYTTFENEELVKDLLIAHAEPEVRFAVESNRLCFQPSMTTSQSTTTKRLEYFLSELIKNERLPELIEVYQRYRHASDSKPQTVFKKIDGIIRNPNLFPFWAAVLEQKNGLSAFPAMPKMNRHRLKNQPENQPDGRHPFDIIASFYYLKKTVVRQGIIIQYNKSRAYFYKAMHYKNPKYLTYLLKSLDAGYQHYNPKVQPDIDAKIALKELINSLRKITVWNTESIKNAQIIWSRIHNIMQSVKERQAEDIKQGKEFKAFNIYVTEHRQDLYLFYGYSEMEADKLLQNETKAFIERAEERVTDILDVHYYPAYVLAAETYLQIGRIYFYVTLGLWLSLPGEAKLKLFNPNDCRYNTEEALTDEGVEYKCNIDAYRSRATQYFKRALVMAGAAKILHLSGDYEAITNNTIVTKFLNTLFTEYDTDCKTLTAYIKRIEAEIQTKWIELYKVYYSNEKKPLAPTVKGLIRELSSNTLFNKKTVTKEQAEQSCSNSKGWR